MFNLNGALRVLLGAVCPIVRHPARVFAVIVLPILIVAVGGSAVSFFGSALLAARPEPYEVYSVVFRMLQHLPRILGYAFLYCIWIAFLTNRRVIPRSVSEAGRYWRTFLYFSAVAVVEWVLAYGMYFAVAQGHGIAYAEFFRRSEMIPYIFGISTLVSIVMFGPYLAGIGTFMADRLVPPSMGWRMGFRHPVFVIGLFLMLDLIPKALSHSLSLIVSDAVTELTSVGVYAQIAITVVIAAALHVISGLIFCGGAFQIYGHLSKDAGFEGSLRAASLSNNT